MEGVKRVVFTTQQYLGRLRNNARCVTAKQTFALFSIVSVTKEKIIPIPRHPFLLLMRYWSLPYSNDLSFAPPLWFMIAYCRKILSLSFSLLSFQTVELSKSSFSFYYSALQYLCMLLCSLAHRLAPPTACRLLPVYASPVTSWPVCCVKGVPDNSIN